MHIDCLNLDVPDPIDIGVIRLCNLVFETVLCVLEYKHIRISVSFQVNPLFSEELPPYLY